MCYSATNKDVDTRKVPIGSIAKFEFFCSCKNDNGPSFRLGLGLFLGLVSKGVQAGRGAVQCGATRRRTKLIMHRYNLLAPFAFVFVG